MNTGPQSAKTSPLRILRPSNLRALMSDHPAIALTVVTLLLLAAVLFGAYRFVHLDDREIAKAYFVNDQTLATEIHSTLQVPPIATPGGELVYGVYMACGDCANKQVAYLQKFSPESKQKLDQYILEHGEMPGPLEMGQYASVPLIRAAVKDAPWVPNDSPEAAAIVGGLKCPEGVNRYPCFAQ